MNQKYDEIMNLFGVDEYKNIVKKWDILSENMKNIEKKQDIVLPNLLWVINSGVGRTNLLNLLSEYLYSKNNLMDFSGNVKFFEFIFNDNGKEIQRFIDTIHNAAGFRGCYHGVVCVDIDEWTQKYKSKLFESFLELLSAHSDEWLIVLTVSENKEDNYAEFISFLSGYLRLETIKIELPSDDDLLVYIKNKLASYDLLLNEEASENIKKSIDKLKKSANFDGFKTLDLLVQDMVYEYYCVPNVQKGELPDRVIEKFMPDSDYINKFVSKPKKITAIGF